MDVMIRGILGAGMNGTVCIRRQRLGRLHLACTITNIWDGLHGELVTGNYWLHGIGVLWLLGPRLSFFFAFRFFCGGFGDVGF
jgi:hypothetical protein